MAKDQINNLDRVQRQDHDTLVRLETKVDNVLSDIKDLRDGIHERIIMLEKRVADIEQAHEGVKVSVEIAKVNELVQWRRDVQRSWKLILGLAGAIGSIIGFVLSTLAGVLNLTK